MPKGALLIDRPTDEEVAEYGDPKGIALDATEDMQAQAPATWREVLDVIGERHKQYYKIDDKHKSVFCLPEPITGEDGKTEETYFFDRNNNNLRYRVRISAEAPIAKKLMNRRLNAYEWSFQVYLSFLMADRDENGNLRDGVEEFPASQDVDVMTEYGTRIQVRRDGMRVVRSSRIAKAYTQDIIYRIARWFIAKWVPETCRKNGVVPPRIRTQSGEPVWVPEGTELGRHAHEVFKTLLY